MIATFKFSEAISIIVDNQEYRLNSLIGKTWNAQQVLTGAYKTFTVSELLLGYRTGAIKVLSTHILAPMINSESGRITATLNMLPDQQQQLLKAKRLFIERLIANYGEQPSNYGIQNFISREWMLDQPRPSPTTIRRWLKKYLQSGKNILSLTTLSHLRGNRRRRIHHKVENLCMDAIQAIYMNTKRRTLKLTLDKALVMVSNENSLRNENDQLPLPTINTIRSILSKLPSQEVYAARHGAQAARVKFRNSVDGASSEKPLQRYEIDHTKLDQFIIDKATGLVYPDRPYLTLIIDAESRVIAGYLISLEPPSSQSLAAALKHAILPKTDIKMAHPDLLNDWPVYGIPESIICDQAMEFHSHAFEDACLTLGIGITYMPRKTPWWKGRIERAIGTLNRSVSQLASGGRTFSSIQEKGDYDPKKSAVMTMDDLQECVMHWIVDIYHHSFHRGTETTPIKHWETMVDQRDIRLPENPDVLDVISGHLTTRKIWHYGIELNHVIYNSKELGLIGHALKDRKATIRWSSEEMGHIFLMLPNGGHLKVPAIPRFSVANGLSLYQYKLCRQDLINKKLDPEDQIALAKSSIRLLDKLEKRAKKYKADLKQQRRKESVESNEVTKNIGSTGTENSVIPTSIPVIQIDKIPNFAPIINNPALGARHA